MSRETLSIPALLAFVDQDQGTWGVVIAGQEPLAAVGQLDGAQAAAVQPAQVRLGASGEWDFSSEGTADAAAKPVDRTILADGDDRVRLVEVTQGGGPGGQAPAGGIAHPGWPELPARSVRLLCAWFSPDQAMGLVAVRPLKARGQDRDEMSVACLGEPEGLSLFDPRLSSTYGGDGALRRIGVEMWLGEDEESDLHSLRMAGEATGAIARLGLGGITLQAQPFVCHSRAEDGLGVYVLIART